MKKHTNQDITLHEPGLHEVHLHFTNFKFFILFHLNKGFANCGPRNENMSPRKDMTCRLSSHIDNAK